MAAFRNLLYLAIIPFTFACSPDNETEPKVEPFEPTPYQLTIPSHFPERFTVPPDNALTEEGVELGRHLFYEKKLSGNNTMSCGSCHQQDKAFTDGKALAVGIDGIAHRRSAMSLANMLWFTQFNWDGGSYSLEEQARGPIENHDELHQDLGEAVHELQATTLYPPLFEKAFGSGTITEENVLKALAQFQRTLISADSRYDRHLQGKEALTPEEAEGMQLFMTHPEPGIGLRRGNCGDCHGGTLFSMRTFHNNGLDDTFTDNGLSDVTGNERHNGLFKAPSLRNIALTAPYMHDGRFATLEEVLEHYRAGIVVSPTLNPELQQQNQQGIAISEADKKSSLLSSTR